MYSSVCDSIVSNGNASTVCLCSIKMLFIFIYFRTVLHTFGTIYIIFIRVYLYRIFVLGNQ
jgi:hypothetical protein